MCCSLITQAVLVKTSYLDVPQRYPPYTSFSVWLLGMLQAARPSWQDTLLKRLVQLLVLVWALRFLRSAGYLRSALEFLLSLA